MNFIAKHGYLKYSQDMGELSFFDVTLSTLSPHILELLVIMGVAGIIGAILGWTARSVNLIKLLKAEQDNSDQLHVRLSAQKRELEQLKKDYLILRKQSDVDVIHAMGSWGKDSEIKKLMQKITEYETQHLKFSADLSAKDTELLDKAMRIKDLELELIAEKTDKIRHESRAGELAAKLFSLQQETDRLRPLASATLAETHQKKDNLKIIEGIGPKIEALFYEAGITTWQELSTLSVEQCRAILLSGGERYRMHDPVTWPKQAALAAAGDWTALDKFQNGLISLENGNPTIQVSGNA